MVGMYTVRMVPNSLLVSATIVAVVVWTSWFYVFLASRDLTLAEKNFEKSLPAQNHRHLNILWIALCHTCLSENYILHF